MELSWLINSSCPIMVMLSPSVRSPIYYLFTSICTQISNLFTLLSYTATTLTGFHFAVTALVGLVSNATGYSASKHVPLWELIWFSAIANISITGMNLSLMLNSVGFYQVSSFQCNNNSLFKFSRLLLF